MEAIKIQNLKKNFGDFKAVDDISFSVEKGQIFGILGPNGAGKSTTIKMLCGILTPSGGSGSIDGLDLYNDTELIKTHIGYMSQKFSLYEDLTVEENIDFFSGIYRVPENKKHSRKEWVITMAHLENYTSLITGNLPGGLKQRLALGCAMIHEPSILFLDEPTSGVDPIHRRGFWNLIYELSEKKVTVLVTTHYMDEAEYCDHIGFIYRGKLIANGKPDFLKKQTMKNKVLELLCESPDEIMADLKKIESIKDLSLFGKGFHIVTTNSLETQQEIRTILQNRNIAVERLEVIMPTLEDVFVFLIESHDLAESQP